MSNILEVIVRETRETIMARKEARPREILQKSIGAWPARSLKKALNDTRPVAIIAESKKASPSAGIICADYDPAAIARQYEQAGACAVSVLTEEKHFLGSPDDLRSVRKSVSLPVLRKDFIVDPYQIFESRADGADAILLIASLLSLAEMRAFRETAAEIGMECLVEVHEKGELDKAIASGAEIIGINNRDLKDLSVGFDRATDLVKDIPAGTAVVIESGIRSRQDIEMFLRQGVHAFLIGEYLMRSGNRGKTLKEFRESQHG